MPQLPGLTFRVEFPADSAPALPAVVAWIEKLGKLKNTTLKDDKRVLDFITNKYMFQNNLQRSLRLKLTKGDLNTVAESTYVFFTKLVTATRAQLEARVAQLEAQGAQLEARGTQLENKVTVLAQREPTTTINNFVLLQNFGNEDMSYLQNPTEYLEQAFAGMRTLLRDIYFNDEQTQNHTVRINVATQKAEVHKNGEWKQITMPAATNTMIGNCRTYLIKGFNSDVHKDNDQVMDFVVSLGQDKATAPLKSDINDGLVERRRRAVEAIGAEETAS